HRHQALLLAERRIAGQRVGVRVDAAARGDRLADVDHRAPLGEAGTQLVVLLQPRAQAVEAFGHHLAREAGQGMGALVDLDARDDAVVGHDLGERHAVTGRLAQGLPVGATVLLRALDADAVETLLDGGVGLVDRDDALARGDHGLGGFGKLFDAHSWTSCRERWETREYSPRVSVPPAGPRSAARAAARVDRHLRSRLVADIDARTVDRRRADDSVTLALGDATAALLVAPAGRDQRVDIDLAVLAQRFGRERVAALEPERRHRIGGAGHIDAGPGLE